MNRDELALALTPELTPKRLQSTAETLTHLAPSEAFQSTWFLALDQTTKVDHWASCLLVGLQPPCPLSCEQVLREISASRLNLSNRLVPFYIATEFGRANVERECNSLIEREYRNELPHILGAIQYWLHRPCVDLLHHYVHWHSSRAWPEWALKKEKDAASCH